MVDSPEYPALEILFVREIFDKVSRDIRLIDLVAWSIRWFGQTVLHENLRAHKPFFNDMQLRTPPWGDLWR